MKLPPEMKVRPGTATVTALLASATDAMWSATVAATGKDQLRLNEDVELRPSFGKGMGVFAMRRARRHTHTRRSHARACAHGT